MSHNLNRIERLDSAARALAALPLFSWGGLVVLWYPLIKMWIWRDEAWIVPRAASTHLWAVIVGVAAIPTVLVLIRQSYAILVIAIVEFLMGGILALLALPKFRLTPDWAYYPTFAPLWILFGFLFLRKGIAVARVYSPGWELERSQVEDWLRVIQRNRKDDNVIEIQESTFLGRNRTYRILNARNCWVMAAFRTGKEDGSPYDFRVLAP